MKSCIFMLTIFILFISSTSFAKSHYTEMKGWYPQPLHASIGHGMSDEKIYFSPLDGAIFVESGFIQSLYEFGEKIKEPSLTGARAFLPREVLAPVELVQNLFFQNGDQFLESRKRDGAAYYMDAYTISWILNALRHNQFSSSFADFQKEIDRVTLLKLSRRQVNRFTVKKRRDIGEDAKTIFHLIEENFRLSPPTCRGILLGFLYMVLDAEGMPSYFESVNRLTKGNGNFQLLENNVFTVQELEHALSSIHSEVLSIKWDTKLTLQSFSQNTAEVPYDLFISALIYGKFHGRNYPPQVEMKEIHASTKYIRTNCVQASFEDFFNILLYSIRTGDFDFSLLPTEVQSNLNSSFRDFYVNTLRMSPLRVNQGELYTWHYFLQRLVPGVDQIVDDVRPLLLIMNKVFSLQAHSFEEIGPMLSTPDRTITLSLLKINGEPEQHVTLHIKNRSGEEQSATVVFDNSFRRHVETEVPYRHSDNEAKNYEFMLHYFLFPTINSFLSGIIAAQHSEVTDNLESDDVARIIPLQVLSQLLDEEVMHLQVQGYNSLYPQILGILEYLSQLKELYFSEGFYYKILPKFLSIIKARKTRDQAPEFSEKLKEAIEMIILKIMRTTYDRDDVRNITSLKLLAEALPELCRKVLLGRNITFLKNAVRLEDKSLIQSILTHGVVTDADVADHTREKAEQILKSKL